MRTRALLRSSAALWTAPVWVGIVVFYFFHALHLTRPYAEVVEGPLWAPQQVHIALLYFYAFAYAITLGLATWDGGRLKRDRVWDLAPGRSRYRVAAVALAPSIVAGWLILLLPVVMRLVETRLVPTPASLLPLLMGMGIVCAYAIVGCALGHITPRLIAAPFSAVAAFYAIAKTSAYSDPVWPRHVSGQLDTSAAFGEYFSVPTVLVPFLFAAAPAAAVAAWWTGAGRRPWRVGAPVAALAVMAVCVHTASGWSVAEGPVTAGHAPARCTGSAPRVCMAEAGGAVEDLDAARREIATSLQRLKAAGVDVTPPATVADSLLYERDRPPSTRSTWWLPLTAEADRPDGDLTGLRYAVLLHSVSFPCAFPTTLRPDVSADWIVNHDAAVLWAAYEVDAEEPYLAWRRAEYGQIANGGAVLAKVRERAAKGRALPTAAQRAAWFEQEKAKACHLAPAPAPAPAPSAGGS
ncbi:PTPA-CTERM sorting domain-containing protein [Streptomyces sp. NPDC007863]|uniref:PTPA-CTERM sorting domain-containing protein n=1 Tax=Streptomyces sp. NPDC007863 TaxID=3154894 RepID=UPI0033D75E09